LRVPHLDIQIGIEVYLTNSLGVGGQIRAEVEDFIVEEMLVDGSKAPVAGDIPSKVLHSTSERQRFLLCILVKRNWDTLIAIKNIARQLAVNSDKIQIAGIKDAKAWTAQHITIDGGTFEDVPKVSVNELALFPVGYVREPLSTYYLLGNRFTIKIRNIRHRQATVEQRLNKTANLLEEVGGIPNFFGHQRFGTTRPITHLVGKAIVLGNFEEAAMLFLAKPSPHEHPASRHSRQVLQAKRDFRQALQDFPRQLRFERLMLVHLAQNPEDFLGAFQVLPSKLQELFVQAHQSFLFNRFLSQRIKSGYTIGRPIVVDFVIGVERSGLPFPKLARTVTSEDEASITKQVKAGKMRVALPIIGMKLGPSEGVMGEIERAVLTAEGIRLDHLRLNPLSKVGGAGGLRASVAPIKELKFKVSKSSAGGCQVELNFMLQRGSYATTLLREMMKPEDPLSAGF